MCLSNRLLRAKPVLTVTRYSSIYVYTDDSWQQYSMFPFRSSASHEQWLAADAALQLIVAFSFCAGFFVGISKYNHLLSTRVFRYLDLIFDSGRAVFRFSRDKFGQLSCHIRRVLVDGKISLSTLENIAGKHILMKAAILSASLSSHCMCEAIRES